MVVPAGAMTGGRCEGSLGGCFRGRETRRAWRGVAGRRLQEPVDAADEVALEGSAGFAAGLAFGLFALEGRLGLGGVAGLGPRGGVERAVELAVAAGVEAVAIGAPRRGGDRCGARQPCELG